MGISLVEWFSAAFALCAEWAGGQGAGLVLLSLAVTALLAPIKRLANILANDEREVVAQMRPMMESIRREADGAERHRRLSRLYRRYGYHPLFALRASAGLFIQLPVLFLAYKALSIEPSLKEVSFWGIPDLSRPDGLLPGGINLLPFVMTAVNAVAVGLTPEFDRRNRWQGWGLSLLFLVLLYAAPSALLVYWTMNNAWSLVSTLLALQFAAVEKATRNVPAPSRTTATAYLLLFALTIVSTGMLCFGSAPTSDLPEGVRSHTTRTPLFDADGKRIRGWSVGGQGKANYTVEEIRDRTSLPESDRNKPPFLLTAKVPLRNSSLWLTMPASALPQGTLQTLTATVSSNQSGVIATQGFRFKPGEKSIRDSAGEKYTVSPNHPVRLSLTMSLEDPRDYFGITLIHGGEGQTLAIHDVHVDTVSLIVSPTPARVILPLSARWLVVLTALTMALSVWIGLSMGGAAWTARPVMLSLAWAALFVAGVLALGGDGRRTWMVFGAALAFQTMGGWGIGWPWWKRGAAGSRHTSTTASFSPGALYAGAACCLTALVFGYGPAMMYRSSQSEFDMTLGVLLPPMVGGGLCLLAVLGWLWLACPRGWRSALSALLSVAVLVALCNGVVLPAGSLRINGLLLENMEGGPIIFHPWRDVAVISGIAAVVGVLWLFRRMNWLTRGVRVALAGVLFATVWGYAATSRLDQTENFSDPTGKTYAFSREKPNYLYIIVDTFRGADFGALMKEDEKLRESFRGFTWYPDVVSPALSTHFSIPAMLGGQPYEPLAMSEDRTRTRKDKTLDAFRVLPKAFLAQGVESRMHSLQRMLEYARYNDAESVLKRSLAGAAADFKINQGIPNHYRQEWDRRLGVGAFSSGSMAKFFVAVSLFRLSPEFLKAPVYGEGNWLGMRKNAIGVKLDAAVTRSMSLGMLPDASEINASNGVFNLMYSAMVHGPCLYPRDSLIPDGKDYPFLFSERHATRLLGQFFDWMRQNGIYDNTTIIVASDHCSAGPTWTNEGHVFFSAFFINSGFQTPTSLNTLGRHTAQFDALLLVKPRGVNDMLSISNSPMAISEIPSLLLTALSGDDPVAYAATLDSRRPRKYLYRGHWDTDSYPDTHYADVGVAEVRGARNDPANWSIIYDGP